MKSGARRLVRWAHLWLGLITGVFICLMGFTGGIVALRPQITNSLSPAASSGNCQSPIDWDRAAREVKDFAKSDINRIYGPYDSDKRYHFRMATDRPDLYRHVIYDTCAGRVLGAVNLGWMDWTVDLHHNLLSGKTGRRWAGAIGLVMLVSGLSGLVLWLLSRPDPGRAFQVELRWSRRSPRELHRAFGLAATVFLVLESFTGLWLCFPQTMRGMLAAVAPAAEDARPRLRVPLASQPAGLNQLMTAAHNALPDGSVREIRLPEDNGVVQVRMWRTGDFRVLGNNVVYLSSSSAQVLRVDRYNDRSASNHFLQAMAGLHYDEWGGLPFRVVCAAAGLVTPVLFITGILLWWYSRPRKNRPAVKSREAVLTASR